MTTGAFPTNPGNRRGILVLQDHDVEKCAYEPGAAQALLDDEVYVLQVPHRLQGEMPPALQNITAAGLARPGTILVQSPFDTDTYEEAALAPHRFAIAKHMYFSTLCMYLGAKEVVVEQLDVRTRSGKSTLDVKGERLGASAQATLGSEDLEMLRGQMLLRDEFQGGPANIAAAEQLLQRTGLRADPNCRSLLDMRRDGTNQLKTRKLALSLSSEAKSNLSVVARLKVPAFVKLSAEFEQVVREQHDYTLTVVVKF